jgi:hypothetical protein
MGEVGLMVEKNIVTDPQLIEKLNAIQEERRQQQQQEEEQAPAREQELYENLAIRQRQIDETQVIYPFIPKSEEVRITQRPDGTKVFANPYFETDNQDLVNAFLQYYAGGQTYSEALKEQAGDIPIPYYQGQPREQRIAAQEQRQRQRETRQDAKMFTQLRPPGSAEEARQFETYNPEAATRDVAFSTLPFLGEMAPQVVYGGQTPIQQDILRATDPERVTATQTLTLGGEAALGGVLSAVGAFSKIPLLSRIQPFQETASPIKKSLQTLFGFGVVGVAEGASRGAFQRAETQADRISNMVREGAYGAAIPALMATMPFVVPAMQKFGDVMTATSLNDVRKLFPGINNAAAKEILETAKRTNPDRVEQILIRQSFNGGLVYADDGYRALASTAIQRGANAARIAMDSQTGFFTDRLASFKRTLTGNLADEINPALRDITLLSRDTRMLRRRETDEAYEAAESATIKWSTPSGRRLEELLETTDPKWIDEANKILSSRPAAMPETRSGALMPRQSRRQQNPRYANQISYSYDADTRRITFSEELTPVQINAIRQGMNDWVTRNGGKAHNPATGEIIQFTQEGHGLNRQEQSINNLFRQLVPEYDRALATARETSQIITRQRLGYDMINSKQTPAAIRQELDKIEAIEDYNERMEALRDVRRGVRLAFDEQIEKLTYGADPLNGVTTDEFNAILNELGSLPNKARLSVLLPDTHTIVFDELQDMAAGIKVQRMIEDARIKRASGEPVEPGLPQFQGLNKDSRLRMIYRALVPRGNNDEVISSQMYDEITRGLFNIGDNSQTRRVAETLNNIVQGRNATKNELDFFFSYIVSPGFIVASQARQLTPNEQTLLSEE